MDNGAIKESELFQLDGTIDKLIESVASLDAEYGKAIESIKKSAAGLNISLKSVSGATKQGRQAIDESVKAAEKLAAAEEALRLATSEVGKQIAWLKAQTIDANKATVAQQRQIQAAATSYNRLKADIKELTEFFKSLTEAERKDAEFGGQVIAELRAKNTELKALNASIKPVVQNMTLLQKTEQQLAYWQSEEGQQVLALRKQIRELTTERKAEKAEMSETDKAYQRLTQAKSNDAKAAAEINEQIKDQQRQNRIAAKVATYAAGSYYGLEARHADLVEQMKRLAPVTDAEKQRFEDLRVQAAALKAEMREMQESIGNYTLGVGDYKTAFSGLDTSVQQVIRELPAAKMGLDTFFLAISNNIPIFADMYAQEKRTYEGSIENIRKAEAAAIKAGKSTSEAAEESAKKISKLNSPLKQVVKSIFSWRTALTLAVSVFTFWGKDIVNWVSSLFQGESALARLTKATKAIRKEMENTNADFGDSMVTIHKLTREWKALKTEADRTQWIKNNESEWRKLDIAIYDVADAEKFFTENTATITKAFQDRARAAAAYALAEKKFEEQLKLMEELREIRAKGPEAFIDPTRNISTTGTAPGYDADKAQLEYETAIAYKEAQISATQAEIDLYFDLADAANAAGDAILGVYIDQDKVGSQSVRNLAEYIAKMRASISEAKAEADTKTQTSEFAKRRKKAKEEYEKEINDLKAIQRKNADILSGTIATKDMTPEQRQALQAAQAEIEKTIKDFEAVYNKALYDVAADEKIATLQRERELIQIKLDTIKEGSEEEYALRKQALQKQYELEIAQNKKLIASERQDETAIAAKYAKQLADIDTDKQINTKKKGVSDIQTKLEGIKAEGVEELNLRKQLLKEQYELELLENSKLATELQQSEADIKAKYDRQIEDLEYEHQMRMIEIKQDAISQKLDITQAGSADELALLLEQIELERKAALKANAQLAADLRQTEAEITAYYNAQADYARGSATVSTATVARTQQTAGFVTALSSGKGSERRLARKTYGEEGSRTREIYDIDTQLISIEAQLTQFKEKKLNLSKEEVANLELQREQLKAQKKELSGFSMWMSELSENGPVGGILGALGLDEAGIEAFNMTINAAIDGLSEIYALEIEMAEQAVEAAQERVDAAQAAYDAEIEARNNGYANSVETARKQLEQEKKNEEEKQKMLEQARKKQQALDAATQASSLVTAVAGLWASYSTMGPASIVLAGIATAALFASFVASQVKAAQVTKQQYGEGGLEFLEGGSHASGNDIDLNTTNGKGKRMYAEGGEAMAIINKRNTRKYKGILPSIVDSLNKGTFEEKFLNAFSSSGLYEMAIAGTSADLSRLENDVRKIREQGDTRTQVLPDGTIITYYKNVKRVIRKN